MNITIKKGFDKKNLRQLRAALKKALNESGIEGLEFDTGGIKFSKHDCTVELKVKIKGGTSLAEKELEQAMTIFGLQREGLRGERLVEYVRKNRKYPFIYELGGKRFKTDLQTAKIYFAKKGVAA